LPDREAKQLLDLVRAGDAKAADRLAPLVYEELRALARHYLKPSTGHTLQPTALVHEAWLKLADSPGADPKSHTHFRAIAAVAMRQVLIDHARHAGREKRGGDRERVTLITALGAEAEQSFDAEAIEIALQKFTCVDPRAARVVEMRFFAGLSEEEIAEILGVTDRTVRNDWRMARAWLRVELGDGA
jgi:RNA polymerase sigma factor (TIGR02999 family)